MSEEEKNDNEKEKVYFNARGVPTDEEVNYLHEVYPFFDLMEQYKTTRGNFYQNETGRLSMVIIAIFNLYKKQDFRLFFDEQLTPYVLPDKNWVIDDPLTYEKTNFDKYRDDSVIPKIVGYIEYRWHTTKVVSSNVRQTISEYLLSRFEIDPFFTAVEKAVAKMAQGKKNWEPVPLPAFYSALSHGISEETAEPYRKRVIEYLLKAPLILRWKDSQGRPLYTGSGLQAMPILYGKQGLGKSTLVRLLGLGWADSIKNVAENSQENIYKRAMNVFLDFGELSGMKKADLEDLKSALTQRSISFNPKYSNGLKTLPANALIVGTTNLSDLLKDLTGERRFWPIAIQDYDYDELDENFILRAFATEYVYLKPNMDELNVPSLNLKENSEDRQYKEENYSQADKSIAIINKFINDLISDSSYSGSVFYGQHDGSFVFASKKKIENEFMVWCDEQKEITGSRIDIYPSKVTNYLLGLPGSVNSKLFRTENGVIRGIAVAVTNFQ